MGSAIVSVMSSNITSNAMPICRFSGVGSSMTMLVGILGPSSSSTIAVTKGTSSTNPGWGARWTIPYVNSVALPLACTQLVSLEKAPKCHTSHYDGRHLRLNCGCAECVEEWTKKRLLDPVTVEHDLKVEDYIPVGKYAIQFLWSDAHYTGIFPFEMLRLLCKCDECISSTA